jgi:hypothetical protein
MIRFCLTENLLSRNPFNPEAFLATVIIGFRFDNNAQRW